MDLPNEIYEDLEYNFKSYKILHCWRNNEIYYVVIYSSGMIYFCNCIFKNDFPVNSREWNIDNKIGMSDIRKKLLT